MGHNILLAVTLNFNPRAPCGARQGGIFDGCHARGISIHAPLAGRDLRRASSQASRQNFNPRAPCGARRHCRCTGSQTHAFQSTRPLRGATKIRLMVVAKPTLFQSTRPLRGATRAAHDRGRAVVISIHAPLAGRDGQCQDHSKNGGRFQSTRPLRGATTRPAAAPRPPPISIHAPLAGRDIVVRLHLWQYSDFNPRAPCGARPEYTVKVEPEVDLFQSTRPLRGATRGIRFINTDLLRFQSTRPLRGATR